MGLELDLIAWNHIERETKSLHRNFPNRVFGSSSFTIRVSPAIVAKAMVLCVEGYICTGDVLK